MAFAAPYDYAFKPCSTGPQSGTAALAAALESVYGFQHSLGIYNCREVAGTDTQSIHSDGRAYDMGMPWRDPRGRSLIVPNLLANASRLGIQLFIWDRTIWSAKHPSGAYYGGVSPHYDHLHIEQNWNGARNLNYTTAVTILRGTPPSDGKDFDVATLTELENIIKKYIGVPVPFDTVQNKIKWMQDVLIQNKEGIPWVVTGDPKPGAQYTWLGSSIVHMSSAPAKAVMQRTGVVDERLDRLQTITIAEWNLLVAHSKAAGGTVGCDAADGCLGQLASE